MLRLFSFLLILIGAGALAFGVYQYMNAGPEPTSVNAPAPPAIAGGFEAAPAAERAAKPMASRSLGKSVLPDEEIFDTAMSTEDFLGSLRTVPNRT